MQLNKKRNRNIETYICRWTCTHTHTDAHKYTYIHIHTYAQKRTLHTSAHSVVPSWCTGQSDGLQIRSKRARTPFALLRSFSDKYPWERYEPYPPRYGLNSTITVLLEGWIQHWITYKVWYAIKQRNQIKLNKKHIHADISKVKLTSLVEDDPKAPFSIATI